MQAYYKERGHVGRNVPNESVLFTQPSAGDRRVPYTRPRNTPLYRERYIPNCITVCCLYYMYIYIYVTQTAYIYASPRLSQLCQNRTVIPSCPQKTQRQSSSHYYVGSGQYDVTSQGVVLSTLPRPDVRAARHFIAGIYMHHLEMYSKYIHYGNLQYIHTYMQLIMNCV